MSTDLKVTVWNEGRHEKVHPEIAKVYPDGLHSAIQTTTGVQPRFFIGGKNRGIAQNQIGQHRTC